MSTPRRDTPSEIRLKASAVYLAAEEAVAKDISEALLRYAETLEVLAIVERMLQFLPTPPDAHEEGVAEMDKTKVGIYEKFRVERTDGAGAEGGKHHGCRYFVLDIDHDPHAGPALEAYAESCRSAYPVLAEDVSVLAQSNRSAAGLKR